MNQTFFEEFVRIVFGKGLEDSEGYYGYVVGVLMVNILIVVVLLLREH